MNPLFLQLFLLVNVFIIGILTAVAVRHARAHFKPHPEDEKPHHPTPQTVHLPPEIKEHLLLKSQANFQAVLDHAATQLQHDLKATASQLNEKLEKLGVDIVNDEMKRYHTDLEALRSTAQTTITGAQATITEHQLELEKKLAERQTELEAQLAESMVAEKQRLTQQIDTKLADAVTAFLTETLQHNVDLGAQSAYLVALLDEHKAELVKGINE